MRHEARGLVLGMVLALGGSSLRAQMPSVGVPKGHLRIEIGGEFATVNGTLFGGDRPYADAWNADIGEAFIPEMAGTDARIRTITGNGSYRLSAGRSSVVASTQVGRGIIGAALGLSHKLTIFGTLPFVRTRAQTQIGLDTTGSDAGLAPLLSANTAFLGQFDAALAKLADSIAAGKYAGAQLTLANQTLADGTAIRDAMVGLFGDPATAAPLIPTDSSATGIAVRGAISDLQTTLAGLSITGWSSQPTLADHRLTDAEYQSFLTSPSGEVGSIFRGDQVLQRPGDAEVGVVYTVVDRPSLRIAATGLVRLPTGLLDRSENFFDLGTGDGQTDLEGRVAADVARGMFGARVSFGYNRQLEATLQRRIFAPSQPIAYAYRAAEITRDPGDEVTIGVEPFVRLAPGFAFSAGAIHWSHGADVVSYAGAAIPGVAASDLAIGTKRSSTALQAGLTYSSLAGITGRGTPIEARWAYRTVVSASGGRVDKTKTLVFQFRAYYKLWGR